MIYWDQYLENAYVGMWISKENTFPQRLIKKQLCIYNFIIWKGLGEVQTLYPSIPKQVPIKINVLMLLILILFVV